MRLLANENVPLASVLYLHNAGFDVMSVGSEFPGISDHEVLEFAIQEQRTIITFDKDYGELIFKHKLEPNEGIIFLRIDEYTPEEPGRLLETLLNSSDFDPQRKLTVLDRDSIRQRKY